MPVQIIDNQRRIKTDKKSIKNITEELLAFLGISKKTLSILFTDNDGIRELNTRFLRRDSPTNVISFSYFGEERTFGVEDEQIIGDIVISLERTLEEAKKAGCSFYERLMGLIIHGILHIMGYDHEKDLKEKRRMRYMEKKLLNFVKSLPSFGGLSELGEKENR
jgi:probable rRNA maturation factor